MMYPWIWRHLPGPVWIKVSMLALTGAILTLALFEWVFPWISEMLPYQDQTVGE